MNTKFALCKLIVLVTLLGSLTIHAASLSIVASSPVTGPINNDGSFPSPQGDYASYTNPNNLALGANVTVSGTVPGFEAIHAPEFLTDGNYGNGSSWFSTFVPSWLIIDLGSSQSFNLLTFGRDRLGLFFDDRDRILFNISVSNNNVFTTVFDSSDFGFPGFLVGDQTVQASFDEVSAQYVRLEFLNAGATIDEVEIMNSASIIPAPPALWLFVSGLIGLVGTRMKRSQNNRG